MNWKRPRRLTYLLRERQPRGKGGSWFTQEGGLKLRGKGVSVCGRVLPLPVAAQSQCSTLQ